MEDMDTGIPGEDVENVHKDSGIDMTSGLDCEGENDMIQGENDESEEDAPVDKNTSDEDDDEDDDDDEDADEAEVKLLRESLDRNPYDYAGHLALIAKLRSMGELDRLRSARENMSSKYPLSSDIWLSWLRDEIKLASTPDQRDAVAQLCERAVKDYTSVEVWLEYLQFSIGSMGADPNAKKNIRQLFERALTSVGLHVTKGAIIWEAFREFENVLVAMIAPEDETSKKEQLEHVGNLFRRQLACPLLDMEKTLEEYEIWRANDGSSLSIDEKIVSGGYKRAFEKLTQCLPFEEKLISTKNDIELLDAYRGYLLHEKQNGDPGRVTVLYERAIADLSLEPSIWHDYLSYLESNIKIQTIIEQTYRRATQNVPWSSKIWQKFMRSMEKCQKPMSEVQTLLETALSAGFSTSEDYRNLWIAYIEYLRRQMDHEKSASDEEKTIDLIRTTFNRACEHLAKFFGLDGDPNCVLLQYWARTEAIHANDMEKARSLWTDIMSQGHSIAAASWLEYINLERCYGDTKHLRKLYHKALTSVKDWPESIANSWMDFERDEGNLEQLEFCELKTMEKLERVAEERRKIQQQQQQRSALTNSDDSGIMGNKRAGKRKPDEGGRWKNLGGAPNKQPRVEKSLGGKFVDSATSGNDKFPTSSMDKSLAIRGEEIKTKKIAPPPGFVAPDDEKMESDRDHEVDDRVTVFVSNLDYTATEDEVREALAPAGPISLVKMIRDYKGRSKGFGYVQLASSNAVEDALKLDRTPIKGRPMFVSRCDPDKTTRGSGFKYACALEKNKLFVKGLPVTTTKEELEELFKVYGPLRDVRLVTYRNGHSKGLAYVEFASEASAGKALLATDGSTVQDKVISVAISKPPERKKGSGDQMSLVKSLGSTAVSRHAFGVPKTLLSMIPRNVKTPVERGTLAAADNPSKQPLNNQDFRNMLLNKN